MEWRRREILKAMVVVAVAWVLFLVGVGYWQRHFTRSHDPKLIHYPGTESVQEQVVQNLGFTKYWFHFDEDYPSTTVYKFYRKALAEQGWRFVGDADPTWVRSMTKDKAQDLFTAGWVSRDGLFELSLQMLSEVKIKMKGPGNDIVWGDREPGLKVYVTQRRVLVPYGFGEKK